MQETTEGFAHAYDGTRIYYRSEGQGLPLVMSNGILCSTGYWVYLRPFFRNRCRVVTFDYRGHGKSELPRHRDNVTIGSFTEDLKAVLDALNLPKVVLVGHSMGVQVILEFYGRYRDRVMGLIPVLGTYGHPFRTFYGYAWPDRIAPPILRSGIKYSKPISKVFKPLLGTRLAIPLARLSGAIHWYLTPADIMKDYFQQIATMDFETAFRSLLAIADHTAEDVLRTIQVPTLIIAGEKDPFTPPWLSEKMWRTIPNAEMLTIPNGTHTALVENPHLMNLRIEVFLRDHFTSQGYQPLKALGTSVSPLTRRRRVLAKTAGKKGRTNQRKGEKRPSAQTQKEVRALPNP